MLIYRHFLVALLILMSSCGQRTGDPTKGGLFGWSQSKADIRIVEKNRLLASITGEQKELADQIKKLEAELQLLQKERIEPDSSDKIAQLKKQLNKLRAKLEAKTYQHNETLPITNDVPDPETI